MSEKNEGLSRREFGKKSALSVTAITSFGILKNAHAAPPMKIGLIGCGGRGTGAVGNAIKANSNVQLVAVHDAFEDRVKGCLGSLRKNENFTENIKVDKENIFLGRDSYKKLVQLDLDYVLIASPPGFKVEQFEAAVNAKKHIFCEKPVSTDPAGTRRFIAAAKKSERLKLSVVTGTQRRHQKPYVETIAKIHDGVIGEPLAGRAYWNGSLPWTRERKSGMSDAEYQMRNWYQFCWNCGDNIVEQHVHNLDVMNWVFKSHPVSVIASGGRAWKPKIEKYGDIWDHFSCDFEYPNDIHVMSFCRHWRNCYNEVSELVMGSKGKVSNTHDMSSGGGRNPYDQEHIDLQASITGDGPYLNEGVQVAESTFTAILGRMAAYTGKKLKWDEALAMDLDLAPKDLSEDAKIPWDNIPVPGPAL